jgi:hypothetical protein
MKILIRRHQCQSRQGRRFQTVNGNERFREISKDNGLRALNHATSENTIAKSTSTMLPHRNIHKYTHTAATSEGQNRRKLLIQERSNIISKRKITREHNKHGQTDIDTEQEGNNTKNTAKTNSTTNNRKNENSAKISEDIHHNNRNTRNNAKG